MADQKLSDLTALPSALAATDLFYVVRSSTDYKALGSDVFAAAVSFVTAPATATSSGTAGQMAVTAFHLYICTATNVWRRVAIGSW